MKKLDLFMPDTLVFKLGEIARKAGDPKRKDVGDPIDRGLILRRLLEEEGFHLFIEESELPLHCR